MDAEQIVHDVAGKVRELITQAEERAAQIVRDAEDEATRIRARAEADARKQLDEGPPPSAANGARGSDDTAGARLVAMNMALQGAPREEIEAKLAAEYDL